MFDRVLVERLAAETVTKGGIMIPEKSQGKVLQATVVAVGPGTTTKVFMITENLSLWCAFLCWEIIKIMSLRFSVRMEL